MHSTFISYILIVIIILINKNIKHIEITVNGRKKHFFYLMPSLVKNVTSHHVSGTSPELELKFRKKIHLGTFTQSQLALHFEENATPTMIDQTFSGNELEFQFRRCTRDACIVLRLPTNSVLKIFKQTFNCKAMAASASC